MMFNRRLTIAVLVAAVSMMGSAGAFAAEKKKAAPAPTAVEKPKPLPDPVARVNGVAIPAADLQKALAAFSKSPSAAQVPPGQEKAVQQFLLNQMIGGELMYQVAKNTPVKDQDKQINDALGRLKARFKTEDEYKKGLQEQGLNEKDLRELIQRNVVIENHIEQVVVPKQVVTDAEVKEFYDKNPETFTQPEQVRASHILITLDAKATDADKKKAKEKIEGLLKQAKAGADFAKLAQENSGCPSSKQGGDLGYFGKGQMVKPFEETAFSMKPGEVSGVVETQFGYHIIKLIEKKAPSKIPFNDVKAKITDSLKRKKVSEAINSIMEDAKKKAKIEVYLK
ncbi:MAG: peptidylprolyl isomerase [Trichlorobacter sp.]|uniref:peptidylprolyl isomerase n=1 Tax=Trichlorobacter sp. TaxID=2911007 RepID=UPI002563FF48|nr:peptidylprolyl isomerase [Trichlorobacter sp.]MDK9717677.1 peptidylprolyl isomerase [Trichlorobacter sp.]